MTQDRKGGTMFEQLASEAASRLGVPAATASTVIREVLSLMTSDRGGGVEGFVDRFRRAGAGDVFTSWFGGKQGQNLAPSQVESALGKGTLDSLAGTSGLSRAGVTTALAFLLPRLLSTLTPNGMLPSTTALRSQVASYLTPAAHPAVERVERVEHREPAIEHRDERRGGLPGWLPWLAAAAAALAAFLWLRGPSGTIEPQLTLINKDGTVSYTGLVRDESTRSAIIEALRGAFGDGRASGNIRVDGNVKRASWASHLDGLVTAVKTPGAEIALNGDAVNVGGWLSAADRQTLTDKLRGMFGAQTTIGSLGDAASSAVRAANDQALSALAAIGTSGVAPDALVRTMNVSIINFPSGSAEIPSENMEIIRKSAGAIARAGAGTTIEIAGHTDNTGDPAKNLALSQARADAVKQALVGAGAPAASLVTRGYGDTQPRASNNTEYGRFQNRRIEYSVVGATR
jgi:outer membrane protein OmpA-like peptidoglycan-associated protein/uncharacterized protein YidB (DUF937 family)